MTCIGVCVCVCMGGRGGEREEGGGREGDAKSLIQPLTLVNMALTKVILEIKE